MFTKEDRSTFPYWFAHWCAFQMTALNCKAWKFKYLFHDMEKPFLKLFLDYKDVQRFHRRHNKHHPEWLEAQLMQYNYYEDGESGIKDVLDRFDFEAAAIDWECSRFTKLAQPLNAYEECLRLTEYNNFKTKYPFITMYCYKEFCEKMLNTIVKLGLIKDY